MSDTSSLSSKFKLVITTQQKSQNKELTKKLI